MDCERRQLLKELMAADFVICDMNLYLDTHPCDQRALMLYNQAVGNACALRMQYEQKYGPLTVFNSTGSNQWRWIEQPWPWQYSK